MVLRTRHTGTLMIDGKEITYDSASLTVGELLETYSVMLVGDDRVEPSRDTKLVNGMTPTVVRVGGEIQQEVEPIPFTEQRQPDPTLPIGQTRVAQNGVDGVMTLTYKVTTENGAQAGRTLLSKVPAVAATPQIIAYGTQADWHWDTLAEVRVRWEVEHRRLVRRAVRRRARHLPAHVDRLRWARVRPERRTRHTRGADHRGAAHLQHLRRLESVVGLRPPDALAVTTIL